MAAISAKEILSLLAGLGFGAMGGAAGGIGGGIRGFGAGPLLGAAGRFDNYLASGYPTEFAPDPNHNYNVAYIPGEPQENAAGRPARETIDLAAVQQTLQEHNDALNKYVRLLPRNATPKQIRDAVQRGREEEKKLPKWWNESTNRRQFQVSSSAVSGIRVTPDGNVEVAWGTNPGKWYTFKHYGNTQKASEAARALLRSDSIGRAVFPVISSGKGGPFMSKKGRMLGEWNAPNYDAAYAK